MLSECGSNVPVNIITKEFKFMFKLKNYTGNTKLFKVIKKHLPNGEYEGTIRWVKVLNGNVHFIILEHESETLFETQGFPLLMNEDSFLYGELTKSGFTDSDIKSLKVKDFADRMVDFTIENDEEINQSFCTKLDFYLGGFGDDEFE